MPLTSQSVERSPTQLEMPWYQTLGQDGLTFLKTTHKLVAQPTQWGWKDWAQVTAISGTAYFLYQRKEKDDKLFLFERLNGKPEIDPNPKTVFEKTYYEIAEFPISTLALGLGATYVGASLFKLNDLHALSFNLIQSTTIAQVFSVLGSYVLSEERPSEGGKMKYFKPNGHSISGHSAFYASFSGPLNRTFTQIQPHDTRSTKILKYVGKGFIYGLPALFAYSRLRHDFSYHYPTSKPEPHHYAWNVFLGLSLGYGIGEWIAHGALATAPPVQVTH